MPKKEKKDDLNAKPKKAVFESGIATFTSYERKFMVVSCILNAIP